MIPKIFKNIKFLTFIGVVIILSLTIPFLVFIYKNQFQTDTSPPKTYSVTSFDKKQVQNIAKKDILEGKGIPNSKITLIFTPSGNEEELTTDSEGKWTYEIPENTKEGNSNLTVLIEDQLGNLASIKSYPVNIGGSSSLQSGARLFIFPIKEAHAQGNSPSQCNFLQFQCPNGECIFKSPGASCPTDPTITNPPQQMCSKAGQPCSVDSNCRDNSTLCQTYRCVYDPTGSYGTCVNDPNYRPPTPTAEPQPRLLEPLGSEYEDWLVKMHKLGIYPALDSRTREIVFVSREEFESEVCNGRRCTPSPDFDGFVNGVASNNIRYLIAIGHELRKEPNCYKAFIAMERYFPDAAEFFDPQTNGFINAEGLNTPHPNCPESQYKDEIEEEALDRFIIQAANSYVLDREDPFRDLVVATDGFFSTGIILKLFALTDGYKGDTELALNTGFAVASIIPPVKVGGAVQKLQQIGSKVITPRTILRQYQFASRASAIRRAIAQGEKIPREVVIDDVAQYLDDIPMRPMATKLQIQDKLIPKGDGAREFFERFLAPNIRIGNGLVYQADEFITQAVRNEVLNFANSFIERTGREIGLNPLFRDVMDNGRIFIVDDVIFNNSYREFFGGIPPGGVRYQDMIVIPERNWQSVAPQFRLGLFRHEAWHLVGGLPEVGIHSNPQVDNAMRLIMEIMTDYAADLSGGKIPFSEGSIQFVTNNYSIRNPGIAKGIFDRLIKKFPELLDDLIEYSLTGNGSDFFDALATKTGDINIDEEKFLRWFREDAGLNPRAIKAVVVGSTTTATLFGGSYAAAQIFPIHSEPPIEIGPDIFIEDSTLSDESVTIISVRERNLDELTRSTLLMVELLETSRGTVSPDQNKLNEVFTIEQTEEQTSIIKPVHAEEDSLNELNPLPAIEIAPQTYEITIPENTPPGEYKLVAHMYKTGSDEILDTDFEIITIEDQIEDTPTPEPTDEPEEEDQEEIPQQELDQESEFTEEDQEPQVSPISQTQDPTIIQVPPQVPQTPESPSLQIQSITLSGDILTQNLDINNPEINIQLPGNAIDPRIYNLFLTINYTSGSPRIINYIFEFNPGIQISEPEINQPVAEQPVVSEPEPIICYLPFVSNLFGECNEPEQPEEEDQPEEIVQEPVISEPPPIAQPVIPEVPEVPETIQEPEIPGNPEIPEVPELTQAPEIPPVISETPPEPRIPQPQPDPEPIVPEPEPVVPEPVESEPVVPQPEPEPEEPTCFPPLLSHFCTQLNECRPIWDDCSLDEPDQEPDQEETSETEPPADTEDEPPVEEEPVPQKILTRVLVNGVDVDIYTLQTQGIDYDLPINEFQAQSYNVRLNFFYSDGSFNFTDYLFNYTPNQTSSSPIDFDGDGIPNDSENDDDNDGILDQNDLNDQLQEDQDGCQDFDGVPEDPSACQNPDQTYSYPSPSTSDSCQYDNDFSTVVPNSCFCIDGEKWATYQCNQTNPPEYANYPVDPWDCTNFTCPEENSDQCLNDDDYDQFVYGTCFCGGDGESWGTYMCDNNDTPEYWNYPAYPWDCAEDLCQ